MRNTLYEHYLKAIDRNRGSRYSWSILRFFSRRTDLRLPQALASQPEILHDERTAAIRSISTSVRCQIQPLVLVPEAPNILQVAAKNSRAQELQVQTSSIVPAGSSSPSLL